MTAETFLDYPIEDNQTNYGGKSNSDERLRDFLADVGLDKDSDMEEVNDALTSCGCEPIPYAGMKNARFAVRWPMNCGVSVAEDGSEIYSYSLKEAIAKGDKIKAKYGLPEVTVEDLLTGTTVMITVSYIDL